jgi:hypothetical protein
MKLQEKLDYKILSHDLPNRKQVNANILLEFSFRGCFEKSGEIIT